jgi:hypothetical protein
MPLRFNNFHERRLALILKVLKSMGGAASCDLIIRAPPDFSYSERRIRMALTGVSSSELLHAVDAKRAEYPELTLQKWTKRFTGNFVLIVPPCASCGLYDDSHTPEGKCLFAATHYVESDETPVS